jgi:hypothetical protein
LEIAEADSTSVFSGVFPVLREYTVLWVKFRGQAGGLAELKTLRVFMEPGVGNYVAGARVKVESKTPERF